MENCPVCKAIYKNNRVCHRCKTDLGSFLDIEEQAERLIARAVKQFNSGDYPAMFKSAQKSYFLMKTSKSVRVFATAALLTGDFPLALDLMR